jgi:hypothetical protein
MALSPRRRTKSIAGWSSLTKVQFGCLGLAEMQGRRIGARRAKAAPDLIDSYERGDVVATRHRRT